MKYVILVLALLGSIVDGFGQSKKEQLTALQASYDSLMLASTRERDSTLAVLAGLMQEKENLSVAKREEASRLNALLANCEKSKSDLEGQIAQVRVELQAHKALLETQSASMRRCEAEKDSMEKATEMDRLYATDWVFFGCISTDDELSETPSSFFVEIARQYFDQDDAIYRVAMALEGRYNTHDFAAGEYTALITDQVGCVQNVFVDLIQPDTLVINASADTVCTNGTTSMILEGYGGTGDLTFTYVGGFDPGVVSEGSYTILLTDENNCVVQTELDVETHPEIIFEISDLTICPGATGAIEYSVTGGTGGFIFNWNELDPNALPAGEYEFSVLDASSCEALASVSISEFSAMQITAQVLDAQGGNNGSILLSVDGGTEPYAFEWDNGNTGNPLIGIGQGNYVASVTDANDCIAIQEFSVIDLKVTELSSIISLYPNPCDVFLRLEGTIGSDVKIFDSTGKLMMEFMSTNATSNIDTITLPAGLYLLMSGTHTTRFAVKH